MEKYGWGNFGIAEDILRSDNIDCDNMFGIDPFFIEKGINFSYTCSLFDVQHVLVAFILWFFV